jgi:hypothetical protein
MSKPLSEATTCPPWCDHHFDNPDTGSRRHLAKERVFRVGDEVVVVGLEWDIVDERKPVVNICCSGNTSLTSEDAAALGAELYRLAAIARDADV